MLHFELQCLVTLTVGLSLRIAPMRWTRHASAVAGVQRLAWLAVSVYASQLWPAQQYTLVFVQLYGVMQFAILSLPFSQIVLFFPAFHVLAMVSFWLYRNRMTAAFIIRCFASSIGIWCLNVWVEDSNRIQWRLHYVFDTEMRRFDAILRDLLPLVLVHRADEEGFTTQGLSDASEETGLVAGTRPRGDGLLYAEEVFDDVASGGFGWGWLLGERGEGVAQEREALVLQLDLCGFTALSQTMTPMTLARTLDELFSSFDSMVQSLNLFKMDTVGDAYIVADFLPHPADDNGHVSSLHMGQDRAQKLLQCAGMMLQAVSDLATHGKACQAPAGVAGYVSDCHSEAAASDRTIASQEQHRSTSDSAARGNTQPQGITPQPMSIEAKSS